MRERVAHLRLHSFLDFQGPVEGLAQKAVALAQHRPDGIKRIFEVLGGLAVEAVGVDEPLGQLAFPEGVQAFLVG